MAQAKTRYLIIGAGPTGLGAAYRLKELGVTDFLVLEASDHVGGLASSFRDEAGFTWDVGGHVQFSHYEYFDRLMDKALGKNGWYFHERESWVWMRERFIPYPLQTNIRHLPKTELLECLSGLLAARLARGPVQEPRNFREWIHASFGEGLAKIFMEPYNFKVWAYPPEELSCRWMSERVATVDLARILENIILEKDDISWGPNNRFRFPKEGGTGRVWEKVAELVGKKRILLSTEITRIDAENRRVFTRQGDEYGYELLLNTSPIDLFVQNIRGFPASLKESALELKKSSSNIVGIGLSGKKPKALEKKCWMYFPEANCPFYRVTVFSNYSPKNVPDPKKNWSLMAEVSESPFKPVEQKSLVKEVISGLKKTHLIGAANKIVSRWQYRAVHGYPTPSVDRDGILSRLHPELEKNGIFSRGRFGAWEYERSNQDHSVMQGVDWVNQCERK